MPISRYTPEMQTRWDAFVTASPNATFLHLRPYMDYHSHRFRDFSLMFHDSRRRLLAMLPACIDGSRLYSHRGLTYGGWLVAPRHLTAAIHSQLWRETLRFLHDEGITQLIYKPVPHIYHRQPEETDIYMLHSLGAKVSGMSLSSTVNLQEPTILSSSTRLAINAAARNGVIFRRSTDFDPFMEMLRLRLDERYHATPVHTTAEIRLLASRFPENIQLHTASGPDGSLLCGTLLFITPQTVHTQYMATTPDARRQGTLAALIAHLYSLFPDRRYFDFGTSNNPDGSLNFTLADKKHLLGGRHTVCPVYTLDITGATVADNS